MSYWLVSVPVRKAGGGAGMVSDLSAAAAGLARVAAFDLPPLKVGTLDQLMALSEDTAKQDTFVGGVAKKIEKTYYEMWRAEAQEAAAAKEREAARAGGAASAASAQRPEEKAPELRIGDTNKTAAEYVATWQWNDVRYPRRSALRLLSDLIMKDCSKSDESLKKQVSEYNEVRSAYAAMERKDQGTLLVKPLGQYVKQRPVETQHLTTLMIVVPRARKEEFLSSYETLEREAAKREREEAARKAAEAEERARKEADRARTDGESAPSGAARMSAQREKERAEAAAREAEAKRLEEAMQDPKEREAKEREAKEREEEEKRKNKKLPPGCNAVVPRSHTILCDEPGDEFILVSVVVLKQGAESYKNLCREKRYTVRPFTYDPDEDKADKERKAALAQKKKNLWNFLIRWCTTSYAEVFTAWAHLKAIRLYVETVLRYGLPYSAQAMIVEPARGKEKQLRELLRNMYAPLAGNNAALTTQLDPNEPDLSGLGAEFFPYVSLSFNVSD